MLLLGAAGTAGSISVAATRAASVTPVEAATGLAGYITGVAAGFVMGVLVALFLRKSPRRERH